MTSSITRRLKHWLTPGHGLPIVRRPESASAPAASPDTLLDPAFRFYVLRADGISRTLLDPANCQNAFRRLRDRLFPDLLLRLTASDIDDLLDPDGSTLLLTPAASGRWLDLTGRGAHDVDFGFFYCPFAIAMGGELLAAGWLLPRCSQAPARLARGHAQAGRKRLALRLVAGHDVCEQGPANPAGALRKCLHGAAAP